MNREDIAALFERLDLRGRLVIAHVAATGFGATQPGPEDVCGALMDAVGVHGTIVMPAFTYAETRPAADGSAVPFHPELPVSAPLGPVAEAFRRHPGVLRSNHPTHSFSAWGRNARVVLSTQRDNNPLGPLKKLNVMRGDVVLLGTTLRDASVVYLAEEQSAVPYLERRTALRINAAGYDERVVLENVPGCGFAFDRLEPRLDESLVARVLLPDGLARLMPVRALVQLAAAALVEDPEVFICGRPDCEACAHKQHALEQFGRERRDGVASR